MTLVVAYIHIQDEDGEHPLYAASYKGHITTCSLLLEKGATVDKKRSKVRLLYWYVHYHCGIDRIELE